LGKEQIAIIFVVNEEVALLHIIYLLFCCHQRDYHQFTLLHEEIGVGSFV